MRIFLLIKSTIYMYLCLLNCLEFLRQGCHTQPAQLWRLYDLILRNPLIVALYVGYRFHFNHYSDHATRVPFNITDQLCSFLRMSTGHAHQNSILTFAIFPLLPSFSSRLLKHLLFLFAVSLVSLLGTRVHAR